MKQTKILCKQLSCSVKLADVSTSCSVVILRAKVKRGARKLMIYRRGPCTCALMRFNAEVVAPARSAPPPSFFMVAIQQPGNSYPPTSLHFFPEHLIKTSASFTEQLSCLQRIFVYFMQLSTESNVTFLQMIQSPIVF